MPQEHHVLRCCSCETFQVHIVKKSKKWECKICGTKQSVKRNYGRGSGKDCRNQVMKLNEQRVLKDNTLKPIEMNEIFEETSSDDNLGQELEEKKPFESKWTKYLEADCENVDTESEDDAPRCLSEAYEKKKRVKKMSARSCSSKKICNVNVNDKLPSESCDNHLFPTEEEERNTKTSSENPKICSAATKFEKDNYKKYQVESKFGSKQSKYAQFLDEDEEDKNESEIKSSNIFGSDLFDLDNINF